MSRGRSLHSSALKNIQLCLRSPPGHMAVSWVEVMILRLMLPGISSAICLPRFLSWSLWGSVVSFADPDRTTWPMNSSFTALLFHTCGGPVSLKYMHARLGMSQLTARPSVSWNDWWVWFDYIEHNIIRQRWCPVSSITANYKLPLHLLVICQIFQWINSVCLSLYYIILIIIN